MASVCIYDQNNPAPDSPVKDFRICESPQYDFPVYMEVTTQTSGGHQVQQVIENYDVHIGEEPPTTEFSEIMNFTQKEGPHYRQTTQK